MQEELITFQTAKLAKEKGFKDFTTPFCFHEDKEVWCNTIDIIKSKRVFAPTQSLLQRWLREVHKIDIQILRNKPGYNEYKCEIYKIEEGNEYIYLQIKENEYIRWFETYEFALERGLYEALKLIPDENKTNTN